MTTPLHEIDHDAEVGGDAGLPPPSETPEERIARLEAERDEWKTHARKHETAAKANRTAAEELAALRAACADVDGLRVRLAEAERDASKARVDLVRHVIAAQHGIPADLLAPLATEEEMWTMAPRLVAWRMSAASIVGRI